MSEKTYITVMMLNGNVMWPYRGVYYDSKTLAERMVEYVRDTEGVTPEELKWYFGKTDKEILEKAIYRLIDEFVSINAHGYLVYPVE